MMPDAAVLERMIEEIDAYIRRLEEKKRELEQELDRRTPKPEGHGLTF